MTITPDPRVGAVMRLPEIIDVEGANQLAADLLARCGQPLTLDASNVRRLGGLGLQVLLAARKTWAAEGVALRVIDPSTVFADALDLFGAPAFSDVSAPGGALA